MHVKAIKRHLNLWFWLNLQLENVYRIKRDYYRFILFTFRQVSRAWCMALRRSFTSNQWRNWVTFWVGTVSSFPVNASSTRFIPKFNWDIFHSSKTCLSLDVMNDCQKIRLNEPPFILPRRYSTASTLYLPSNIPKSVNNIWKISGGMSRLSRWKPSGDSPPPLPAPTV